jgi:putative spermidine/putrescine transport system ATP-binding protein
MTLTTDSPATVRPGDPARRGTRIRLEHVVKRFGAAEPAVDDVSLTIEPGEFMTLLGPSGSGKTTTLNLVAGFETLSSGSITLNDVDVSRLPPHRRDLGMLFQSYALFPHLTVAQNVAYPLRARRMPKPEISRRVAQVLELVQLTGRDTAYPAQLSGGQQQRVALARAIVFDPKALLLDEPLGALDRNLRAALQVEIRRIHRELGSTFVFVTHDQEEAMNLSDRITLFRAGRIEQIGSPEELYRRPDTLFAATFLGDSTVFELDGPVDDLRAVWRGRGLLVEADTVSAHPGVARRAALVVRPEDVAVAPDGAEVPAGANAVPARVRDIEYMGSYRSVLLDLDGSGLAGRARLSADDTAIGIGDEVRAWWWPRRQRIVAA